MISHYLKEVPTSLKRDILKEITEDQERYYSFSRNYFLVSAKEAQYITKEPMTMLQLLPALLKSELEVGRSIEAIDRKDAVSLLGKMNKLKSDEEKKKQQAEKKKETKKAAPVEAPKKTGKKPAQKKEDKDPA